MTYVIALDHSTSLPLRIRLIQLKESIVFKATFGLPYVYLSADSVFGKITV